MTIKVNQWLLENIRQAKKHCVPRGFQKPSTYDANSVKPIIIVKKLVDVIRELGGIKGVNQKKR